MAVKKSNKKMMSALFARSRILALFTAAAAYLYGKAECSIAGRMLTSYDINAAENSLICRLFGRLKAGSRFFRPLKRGVSRAVSGSVIIGKAQEYLRGWLYTKLNVYGLFAITAGIGFLFVHFFKAYWLNSIELSILDVFVSVLSILLSIPLMFSSAVLKDAVCGSRMAKSFLFDCLGCKREAFEREDGHRGHSRTALPAGIVLCMASWWIRPVILFASLIALVFCLMILYVPETGIVGLIFLIPFISADKITALIAYTAVCFFFKYIRGKRTVRFEPLTAAVLVFALLLRVCGGLDGRGVCVIGSFFLAVNLIKSKVWINRCAGAFTASFFAVAVYGLSRYVSYALEFDYFVRLFKCAEVGEMVSFFESPAEFSLYIVTVLPIAVFSAGRKKIGLLSRVAVAAGIVCLILTYEYRAWAGLTAGMILFLILYGKNTLAGVGGIFCVLPFVAFNLPDAFREKVTQKSVTDYFLGEIRSGLDGFTKGFAALIPLVFILILFLCLQKNVTVYSKGGSMQGKRGALAALSGMAGFVISGADASGFSDYRICLVFWLCTALFSCTAGAERNVYEGGGEAEYGKGELF